MDRIVVTHSPRVINIEPIPLIAAMNIEAVGLAEQVYYTNINRYAPDRTEVPLTLRSSITLTDYVNGTTNIPEYSVEWIYFTPTESQGVVVTSQDPMQDFYVTNNGKDLVVRKNIPHAEPYTIKCVIAYTDNRTASLENIIEKSIVLNTVALSEQEYPKLNIKLPNTSWFNPITMEERKVYEIKAEAHNGLADITGSLLYVWYAKEADSVSYEPIDTVGSDGHCKFLCYEFANQNSKGQGTDTIYLDAMFTEDITIMLMARRSHEGSFYPDRVYRNIKWRIPTMDIRTSCLNGDNMDTDDKLFENIVTAGTRTLTEEQIVANLRFDWYSHCVDDPQDSNESHGIVPMLPINPTELANADNVNVNMYNEITVLGAYKKVTLNNENVTLGGELIISREGSESL